MTSRRAEARDRKWFRDLAQRVAGSLEEVNRLPDLVLRKPSSVRAEEADTSGWVAELGYIRGDRGSQLQMWFDRWTSPGQRRIYLCYKETQIERVKSVAAAGLKVFGTAKRFDDEAWHWDKTRDYASLVNPLPASLFGKPIVELYERNGSWSFYGLYFRGAPSTTRKPNAALVNRTVGFFSDLSKGVIGQTLDEDSSGVYARVENRQRVAQHLRRERSRTLARKAKIRDGYSCQVCDLNFEEAYGRLGRGFAEAHHLVALSRLTTKVKTNLSDLSTVCSNCHRVSFPVK